MTKTTFQHCQQVLHVSSIIQLPQYVNQETTNTSTFQFCLLQLIEQKQTNQFCPPTTTQQANGWFATVFPLHATTTLFGCQPIFCETVFHWVGLCVFAGIELTIATPDLFQPSTLPCNEPCMQITNNDRHVSQVDERCTWKWPHLSECHSSHWLLVCAS